VVEGTIVQDQGAVGGMRQPRVGVGSCTGCIIGPNPVPDWEAHHTWTGHHRDTTLETTSKRQNSKMNKP
jgi:hypothetical protein